MKKVIRLRLPSSLLSRLKSRHGRSLANRLRAALRDADPTTMTPREDLDAAWGVQLDDDDQERLNALCSSLNDAETSDVLRQLLERL